VVSYVQDNAIQLNVGEIDRVITVNCFGFRTYTIYCILLFKKGI